MARLSSLRAFLGFTSLAWSPDGTTSFYWLSFPSSRFAWRTATSTAWCTSRTTATTRAAAGPSSRARPPGPSTSRSTLTPAASSTTRSVDYDRRNRESSHDLSHFHFGVLEERTSVWLVGLEWYYRTTGCSLAETPKRCMPSASVGQRLAVSLWYKIYKYSLRSLQMSRAPFFDYKA